MKGVSVLISGAGVAGPTLAYWLLQHGFTPTIVERAPQFRTGGYVVDFWGVGYDVADKMGVLPNIKKAGYSVNEVRIVNQDGKRIGGFDASVFDRATNGRYTSIPRGDLALEIYSTVRDKLETIFDDSITSLEEVLDGVAVEFEHAPARKFDLVIGADGLHSKVRELTFGDESRFETHLGYLTAAFEVYGYPRRDENVYLAYNVPGKQMVRFSMNDDKTLFFFVFTAGKDELPDPHDTAAHKVLMHRTFDDAGWECREMMHVMDLCEEVYFDRVSQIHMPQWSKGRIALVGDAAFCPSLLAGEGTSLGMGGAYVLAYMLSTHDDYTSAFRAYEEMYRPLMERKQKAAARFANSFAPKTASGLWLRNTATKLFAVPFLADLFLGNSFKDYFTLPK
jgi:2-polyprenyl-6-methoxyphenol hydroxylase-like FAD-dependent oxidoreductase